MIRSSIVGVLSARFGRWAAGTGLALGVLVAVAEPGLAQTQTATAQAASVSPSVVPAEGRGPALWVVRDADSTIYLFGTVHVLKPTTPWGTARVDAAFHSASDIWFEISNPDDQAALIPLMRRYGASPQTPLSSLLSGDDLGRLDAAARTVGASAAQFNSLRPWLAALTLSVAPLAKAGYDPASGVELILKRRAEAAGKSIHGFETIDKQVALLAEMPQDAQLAFLRSTLDDFDHATTELNSMVQAWSQGDVASLNRLVVQDMKAESPALYEVLLARRNADWADQIQRLLAGSGTAFIAVGAGHLTGDDSVQSILESRGVAVSRNQD